MQWEAEPDGGFTTGKPWLPLTDPEGRSVGSQRGEPGSMIELHRRLIALRRELAAGIELVEAGADVLAYRRGGHVVALNLGDASQAAPAGARILSTLSEPPAARELAPGEGAVFLAERSTLV
jgi:alpha-glucosidase